MQRGYSGGQKGRVTRLKQVSALAQMVRVHIPKRARSGLRVWLIYSDIKKTTGAKSVLSLVPRAFAISQLSASACSTATHCWPNPRFIKRSGRAEPPCRALLAGMPVRLPCHSERPGSDRSGKDIKKRSTALPLVAAVTL